MPEVNAGAVGRGGRHGDLNRANTDGDNDLEATLYSAKSFKPSWFSREDVEAHAERVDSLVVPQ